VICEVFKGVAGFVSGGGGGSKVLVFIRGFDGSNWVGLLAVFWCVGVFMWRGVVGVSSPSSISLSKSSPPPLAAAPAQNYKLRKM
jgi:hypothetical protein